MTSLEKDNSQLMAITFFYIKNLLESNEPISKKVIKYLLKHDLILNSINTLLPNYFEFPINFEPTYKRNSYTGNFKLQKRKFGLCSVGRLPGYTDRVMFKTHLPIKKYLYDSIPLIGNDHFPILFLCNINNFNIGILSWNIGNGNPEHISPHSIHKYFSKFREIPHIFVISFQEASINTNPNIEIWDGIYNSSIALHGNNVKSVIGHIVGFGLETTILWNSDYVQVQQIIHESNIGSITKGCQTTKLRIYNEQNSITLCLSNIHAPFTSNFSKYSIFFNSVFDLINYQSEDSDVSFLFGDFNSRSMLRLTECGNPLILKDININKYKLLKHLKGVSFKIKSIIKNKTRKLDFNIKSPLHQNKLLLQLKYTDYFLYFKLKQ
tara:strand:- start:5829 stop:6968 length:1140 start_codon:yes stop_codon:yes gene_type:complete